MRGAARYNPGVQPGSVYPEHLAGMIGLPSVGDIYYIDAASGSDNNNGRTRNTAFATIKAAHDAMTADQDDVAIIVGSNSTGRTAETSTITWSKRRTHLIGNVPDRRINSRVGLGTASTLTGETTTAIFTVTGNNCVFANMSFADFQDNNILVEVESDYNTFRNVHFQGMGIQASADDANARSLLLDASEENEFVNCTIGIDTVTRGAANASLELTGTCSRNKFIGCDFPIFTDAASPFWVKADTGNAYERFLTFENCNFFNPDAASSTTLTVGMDLSTTGNGDIFMVNSWWRGATDLTNNYDNLYAGTPAADTANAGLVGQVAT